MSDASGWQRHLRASLRDLVAYDVPPAQPTQIRLHANECPEPWPRHVMEAIADRIREIELGRYPDTSGRRLRRILGEKHGCDSDRVVLGNGSDEVISLLITALSQYAGAVVTPAPTFVMYSHSARVLDVPVLEVPVDDDLQLMGTPMREALRDAALCFLARPNNPTGILWDAGLIAELIAEHPGTVFVIDEAYAPYTPGSSMWRADAPDNQVHMGTMSKVGAASIRVGYCIASPELAAALHKIRHPYNISATSLAIAELLLTEFADEQAAMIERAIGNRERLRSILGSLEGGTVLPSASNLVVVRLRSSEEATRLWTYLRDRDILTKNLSDHPTLQGCLRVSLGTRAELDRLEEAIAAFG